MNQSGPLPTHKCYGEKSVSNCHLYSSKYFSRELSSEQVQVLLCGSGCHRGAQGAASCFSAAHGELEPFATELILVLWRQSREGEGRKQQAYIKSSLGSEPLPRGDKERWINYSGTSSTPSSQITSALCLVKAHPCSGCLVSVPCHISCAKLICWGSANVPARAASITPICIYSETSWQCIWALFAFQITFSTIPHLSQKLFPAQGSISAGGTCQCSSGVLATCGTVPVTQGGAGDTGRGWQPWPCLSQQEHGAFPGAALRVLPPHRQDEPVGPFLTPGRWRFGGSLFHTSGDSAIDAALLRTREESRPPVLFCVWNEVQGYND